MNFGYKPLPGTSITLLFSFQTCWSSSGIFVVLFYFFKIRWLPAKSISTLRKRTRISRMVSKCKPRTAVGGYAVYGGLPTVIHTPVKCDRNTEKLGKFPNWHFHSKTVWPKFPSLGNSFQVSMVVKYIDTNPRYFFIKKSIKTNNLYWFSRSARGDYLDRWDVSTKPMNKLTVIMKILYFNSFFTWYC